MRSPLLATLLGVACLHRPEPFVAPTPIQDLRDRVDWQAAEAEVVAALSGYLRIPTVSGAEAPGAAYLADLLAAEGIDARLVGYAPGSVNLIARLPAADATAAPLCLLSHIDVVDADPAAWPEETGPWSGALDEDGYLWGRGALDMKSLGILQLYTLVWLARLDAPLTRDVVLLAVSGEEVDNSGARWLVEHWDEIGCSHLINEGGLGIEDAFFEGEAAYLISTGEKGIAWVDLVATGPAGHGSTPMPDASPGRLRDALERLDRRPVRRRFPEPLFSLLDAVGRHHGGLTGAVLASPFLVRTLARRRLLAEPAVDAVTHDTCNVTGFGGARAHNVVAPRSWAHLDCRLLPGTDPEAFVARLRDHVAGEGIAVEVVHLAPGLWSPTDDDLYRALAAYAVEGQPDAVAGPVLSVGTTDSHLLRPLGVRAYGFSPLRVRVEDAHRMHGVGERVHRDELGRGLRILLGVVAAVAVAPS